MRASKIFKCGSPKFSNEGVQNFKIGRPKQNIVILDCQNRAPKILVNNIAQKTIQKNKSNKNMTPGAIHSTKNNLDGFVVRLFHLVIHYIVYPLFHICYSQHNCFSYFIYVFHEAFTDALASDAAAPPCGPAA